MRWRRQRDRIPLRTEHVDIPEAPAAKPVERELESV
jgi:hypothetical protein